MLYYIFHVLPFQDGRIDYNEFVAMMQRGNADLSKNGLKGGTDFSIGFREVLSVCWEKVEIFFMLFPRGGVKLIALEKLSQGLLFCKIVDRFVIEENSFQTFGFQLVDI